MKKLILFSPFLAASAIVTIIMLLVYAAVQQSYRSSANDPQLQIAADISERLKTGGNIERYFGDTIDLERGLGWFAGLYESNGKTIRSSGYLDGVHPLFPKGVFEFARLNGEDVVTWQPRPGVRMATVVLHVNLPAVEYIVVGRSLREVESREHQLVLMVLISWLVSLGIIGIAFLIRFLGKTQ